VIEGYTDNMKQTIVELQASSLKHKAVGEFVQVKIVKAIPFKLY